MVSRSLVRWGVLAISLLAPALGFTQQRVSVEVIASGLTSNTTSAAVAAPNGRKSFSGTVVCSSGACTQTQAIYGTNAPTADLTKAVLLCTLTLADTPSDFDACPVVTAAFARYFVVTSNTTGTNASGAIYVSY